MSRSIIKIIKEQPAEDLTTKNEREYELIKTGSDVVDHEGIKWILLSCPYCGRKVKFHTISTTIVIQPSDEYSGEQRDFHTLAKCGSCQDIVYVKYLDYDFDPDYYMDIEFIYPLDAPKKNDD